MIAARRSGLSRSDLYKLIGALMVAMVLAALDGMIVATALPTIVGELGGLDHLSWVVTAYLLTSTAAIPLFGKISDLYGRRVVFQAAIVIFLIGSAACGLAQDMFQLIVARGFQGIGGGGLQAMTFVILGEVVSPRERGRYVGWFTAVFAVSSVVGPLAGGIFTDTLTWRWAFYINVPFGILALVTASRYINLPPPEVRRRIDILGATLLVSGVTCLLLVTVWGGEQYPWASTPIFSLIGAGAVLLVLFVVQERRAPEPLIPLRLFAEPAITLPTIIGVFLGAVMVGGLAFLPLFLQVVEGASATQSGFLMLPLVGGMVIASNSIGRIIAATGRYKIFPIVGCGLGIIGFALLAAIEQDSARLHLWGGMFLIGFGVGSAMPVTTVSAQNAAPPSDLGAATGVVNFFRSLGSAFGSAALGAVLTATSLRSLGDEVDRSILNSPEQIRALPADLQARVVGAITDGVAQVFLVGTGLIAIAFVLSWFLKELPLRSDVNVNMAEGAEELFELDELDDEEPPDLNPAPATA